MDIRNWVSGTTKAKAHKTTDKVEPNSSLEIKSPKKELDQFIILDSDEEELKRSRKRLRPNASSTDNSFITSCKSESNELSEPLVGASKASFKKDVVTHENSTTKHSKQSSSPIRTSSVVGSGQKLCLDDMKIAVSGVFDRLTREEVEDFILQNGGKISSSISGKTNLLVIGHRLEDGREVKEGSKYRTAQEKGIPIFSEEEFFQKYKPQAIRTSHSAGNPDSKAPLVKASGSVLCVDNHLWVDKYRPKSTSELIGHGDIAKKLTDWLRSWNDIHLHKKFKPSFTKENPGARAVLLSGPPGIGKTSVASMIAKSLNYDILELNASDTRNKAEIDQILLEAISSRALSSQSFSSSSSPAASSFLQIKNRVVIMDEVDGMGGSDRGGISELLKMIKISKIPIICICNDRQSPKIRSLANNCFDLRVKRPTKGQIAQRLVQIAAMEGTQVDLNAAELLVEQSGNDIRQALNALQMWSISGKQQLNYQEMKEGMRRIEKDKVLRQSPFDACLTLLEGGRQQSFDDRYNSFFIDYSLVPLLLQQNYIDASKSGVFRNPQLDDVARLESLARASDSVSDVDLVGAKIRGSDQHWELLPTQAVFSVKVGFHVQGFQAFPAFPAWLGKYSTTSKKQRLTKEIVHHTCLSIGQGFLPMRLDYIPFLRQALLDPLLRKGKEGVPETIALLDHYDLSKEDFSESLRELQFKLENDKTMTDAFDRLDTQTKTALTRLYNSSNHKSATVVQTIGTKKSRRVSGGKIEEETLLGEEGEEFGLEDNGEAILEEEDEEEDLEALRLEMSKSLNKSKAKKNSKDSLTKTKASSSRK